MAFVAGNIRVPKPATGITAFLTLRFTAGIISSLYIAHFMNFISLTKNLRSIPVYDCLTLTAAQIEKN
jgi:hypothetical protein